MRNIRKRWWLVAAAALLLLFLDVAMYIQIKEYYPDFMKQEEASTPVTGQGLDANQQNIKKKAREYDPEQPLCHGDRLTGSAGTL